MADNHFAEKNFKMFSDLIMHHPNGISGDN